MKQFSIQVKTGFLITVLTIVVVLVLAVVIISQNIKNPKTHSSTYEASPGSTISVNMQTPVAMQTGIPALSKETSTDKPLQESDGTVTSIQSGQTESNVKPTPPPKPVPHGDVTDKNKKPSYSEQSAKPQQSQPNNGDKNGKGEIYVEGFGWVKDEGGGGKGTDVDSKGDINTQVGSMD